MIKSELLKKIEAAKDDEDINNLLKGTDIESAFKVEVQPTLDMFKTKLSNDNDFKSFMNSEKGAHAKKVLETWQTKNLPTIINDEVLKATGQKKTPEQIRMEELEKSLNEEKSIRIKTENTSKLKDMLSTSGLDPVKTLEFFNIDNIDNAEKSISNFKAILDEGIKAGVKTAMADGNYTPPGENGAGELTADDLVKMMM